MFHPTSDLNKFVADTNAWRKMFKKSALSLTNAQDRQTLANIIDSELSPENLSCDGELPRSVVQKKYTALTALATKLQRLDPSVKFYEFG